MYTIFTMLNLINITQARNNLSKLIDEIVEKKQPAILIRESVPQVAIIPYEQYQQQEEKWQDEFRKIMKDSKKRFKVYLKNKGVKYPKTEEEMYEIIDKITGRS